ncbi:MAG: hypothetical protein FJY56_10485 [Betaproteobacteria bacterium]|nr:hypothetical protein [Betaproteobacteria bacterium]
MDSVKAASVTAAWPTADGFSCCVLEDFNDMPAPLRMVLLCAAAGPSDRMAQQRQRIVYRAAGSSNTAFDLEALRRAFDVTSSVKKLFNKIKYL